MTIEVQATCELYESIVPSQRHLFPALLLHLVDVAVVRGMLQYTFSTAAEVGATATCVHVFHLESGALLASTAVSVSV